MRFSTFCNSMFELHLFFFFLFFFVIFHCIVPLAFLSPAVPHVWRQGPTLAPLLLLLAASSSSVHHRHRWLLGPPLGRPGESKEGHRKWWISWSRRSGPRHFFCKKYHWDTAASMFVASVHFSSKQERVTRREVPKEKKPWMNSQWNTPNQTAARVKAASKR